MLFLPKKMINSVKRDYYRNEFVSYIERWLLKPYGWGGDDFRSIDCSGLVVEGLKMLGRMSENQDATANGLYLRYKDKEVKKPYRGCLVLWFNTKGVAKHVAICKDQNFIIHASGGGPSTDTIQDAVARNAFVKQRLLDHEVEIRKLRYLQRYKIVDPFKK